MNGKLINIVGVVILLLVSANLYQGCTSGSSEKELKQLIELKENEIGTLKEEYTQIIEREQELLVEITALKDRVTELRLDITEGEKELEEVKNELIDIDSAIAIIHDHTSRAVSRGMAALRGTVGSATEDD